MASTPDVGRASIFDPDKRYFLRRFQQTRPLFAWDVNEDYEELAWWQAEIRRLSDRATNDFSRMETDTAGTYALDVIAWGVTSAQYTGGLCFQHGRPLVVDTVQDNSSVNHYIVKGTLSSVTEVTPGTTYDVVDGEKAFVGEYYFPSGQCTFMVTSGVHASATRWPIDGFNLASQKLTITGNLPSLAPGDTYTIHPPLLASFLPGPKTVELFLLTWYENVSGVEDTDLVQPAGPLPGAGLEPSQRRQLRWCIFPDYPGGEFGTDPIDGFISTKICDLNLTGGTIDPSDPVMVAGYEMHNYSVVSATIDDLLGINQVQEYEWSRKPPTLLGITTGVKMLSSTLKAAHFPSGWYEFDGGDDGIDIDNSVSPQIAGETMAVIDGPTETFELRNAGTTLAAEDLAVGIAHFDGGYNLERHMSMGAIPQMAGFDWHTYGGGPNLAVMPGQFRYGSTLLQMTERTNLGMGLASSWYTGVLPVTSGWAYVYMYPSITHNKVESFLADLTPPNWAGFHPEGRPSTAGVTNRMMPCVGAVWWTHTSNDCSPAVRRGDTVFLSGETALAAEGFHIASGIADVLLHAASPHPSPIMSTLGLEIQDQSQHDGSGAYVDLFWQVAGGPTTVWVQRIQCEVANGGVETVNSNRMTEIPGNLGTLNIQYGGTALTPNLAVALRYYRMQLGFTPSQETWS